MGLHCLSSLPFPLSSCIKFETLNPKPPPPIVHPAVQFNPISRHIHPKFLVSIHGADESRSLTTRKMIRSVISRNPPFPWLWFRVFPNKPTLPSDYHGRSPFHLYHYYSSAATSTESRNPVADYLISRHQFSIAAASKVSSEVQRLGSFDRYDTTLNWFKDIGFSQNQLENLLSRFPRILSTDLEKTLKPKYQIFCDLGFPPNDIADIIAVDPWLLFNRAANCISSSLMALMSVLGSVEEVSRALKICTWFLKTDLDKNLLVNIEFLQEQCGVRPVQIRRFLFSFPRLLLSPPEFIRNIVRRVDEMGFGDRSSGMFLHAVRAMASMKLEIWEMKLEVFKSLGMSEEDISSVFRKSPQVFATSDRKIREVVDLLVGSGKGDMSLIVRHPGLLLFSAEKRIKPRMLVLDELEARCLIKTRPGLSVLCKLSKRDFLGRYVLGETCFLDKLH